MKSTIYILIGLRTEPLRIELLEIYYDNKPSTETIKDRLKLYEDHFIAWRLFEFGQRCRVDFEDCGPTEYEGKP